MPITPAEMIRRKKRREAEEEEEAAAFRRRENANRIDLSNLSDFPSEMSSGGSDSPAPAAEAPDCGSVDGPSVDPGCSSE